MIFLSTIKAEEQDFEKLHWLVIEFFAVGILTAPFTSIVFPSRIQYRKTIIFLKALSILEKA